MQVLFVAIGIGITAWLVLAHAPIWMIVISIVMDAYCVLKFLQKK